MRSFNRALATCLLTMAALSGCSKQQPAPAQQAAAPPPTVYSASAFFTTTSYSLAGGLAWSPDDKELLISSDETGTYNAQSLAATGGAKGLRRLRTLSQKSK